MQVAPQSLATQAEFAAEIRPRVESRIGFRVAGKITARKVELGQTVRAGQVLATLDPQDYRLGADAARAAVSGAQVNLDLAQADYKRFKDLFDQNFISRAELERRETSLKAAQAQLEQAKASAAVQTNQAQYTTLVADVAGVVTSIDAQPGQVVSAGSPVVTIAQAGPRDAVFAVPEDRAQSFRAALGMPVKVKLWGAAGDGGGAAQTLPARIREVAQAADPATRTYLVKADVGNANVTVGQSGTVLVDTGAARAGAEVPKGIKLPMAAVFEQGGRSRVWVFDPKASVVRAADVKVVGADGNEAVLAAGLQPGQVVVTAGTHVLSEGQKVVAYVPPKGPQNGGGK
jgi:RND family efflux transporter MFP subunit